MAVFRHHFTVRFADVDHAGIVYYPVFYHYFHVAFEELFRERMGAAAYVKLLDEERVGFPAVHSECDYRAPLRFADEAETEIALDRMGTRSVTLRYRVSRISDEGRDLAAEGRVTCAVTDLESFRAIEPSCGLRELFLELRESVS
ncbi:MAG: acyl-CoA thioesterase [Myxococcales bacterium]|nr:acyl-CoA thioesterase [Myxococcales bacterium]